MDVIELGGAEIPQFHPNLDRRKVPNVDIVADLESAFPLKSEAFDLVYSQFAMEHVSWRRIEGFISEIFRILKPKGKAVIITSDLRAQFQYISKKTEWSLAELETIFGSQDFPENGHKSSMSQELAVKLFKNAGFINVKVTQVGVCATDMQIEGEKMSREELFDRKYFDGGGYGTGKGDFYRDFPQHYKTAEEVLKQNPKSVLEVGGARGYICRILKGLGIPATCMDISVHCWHTRATEDFALWDATIVPWDYQEQEKPPKFPTKSYDLCFSIAFLEHIPEDKLEPMIEEMARVTKRGLHGITFKSEPSDQDKTHVTIKPKEWWEALFKRVAPKYPVEIVDKDTLEEPVTSTNWNLVAPSDGLEKLNIGCFADMFYYGWKNVDKIDLREWAKNRNYIFEPMDVATGIQRQNNSVDIILASHFLEHLNREQGAKFLTECYRVLKPNGLLRIAVPDAKHLAESYRDGRIMEYRHVNIGVDNAPDDAEAFFQLLLAGHQTIYDFESTKNALGKAGFSDMNKVEPFESASREIKVQTVPMYPTLSIYVEARKAPIPETKPESQISSNHEKRDAPSTTRVKKTGDTLKHDKDMTTINATSKSTSTRVEDKLRIALLSTPLLQVPPKDYGGLELIVANLGKGLVELGHDVTIFAPSGSKVEGCTMVDVGEAKNTVFIDWLRAEKEMLDKIADKLSDFDIIHGNNWFGMEYSYKAMHPNVKVCHTHHGGLLADWWLKSRAPFKLNMIGISDWMKSIYEGQGIPTRTVYNGTDMNVYPLQRKKGDRFLWLSRIAFFKSPHKAIEIAKNLGLKLDVAGATQFVEDAKYVEEIKKSCDGEQIRFIGEVTNEQKVKLMQNAKALIVPAKWGEPFGLHVIETMATGTTVVAIADGGIKETIKMGGYLCEDQYALEDTLKSFKPIAPTLCRKNAMLFDIKHMAQGYVEAYRDIIAGKEW